MTYERNEIAYGFVEQIDEELSDLGLMESEISLDVKMHYEGDQIILEYEIETQEWVEKELEKDPAYETGSYIFRPSEDSIPDQEHIEELLCRNFLDTPLSLNDVVLRESFSPDYDAF